MAPVTTRRPSGISRFRTNAEARTPRHGTTTISDRPGPAPSPTPPSPRSFSGRAHTLWRFLKTKFVPMYIAWDAFMNFWVARDVAARSWNFLATQLRHFAEYLTFAVWR